MEKIRIAIDGPSGSGKSTLAKNLARELSLVYVDTGALYRSVGLFVMRAGADPKSAAQVTALLDQIDLKLVYTDEGQRVILCGEDVSDLIRTNEISMYASSVSAIPTVRKFLLAIQKKMAADGNVVMDGRDIGTVIMPDADVKLFLESNSKARARRRYEELVAKGHTYTEEEVYADIVKRDENDSNREVAPAIPADDAIFLDNSELTREETVEAAMNIIAEKLKRKR
ncbi:MAG: (d)CMP kinase [Clostridia bacterium]|nr:(d)CMP kinase [Clostridia bacterium]